MRLKMLHGLSRGKMENSGGKKLRQIAFFCAGSSKKTDLKKKLVSLHLQAAVYLMHYRKAGSQAMIGCPVSCSSLLSGFLF